MQIGLSVLENTDWSRLHHAYGRATDTPKHLQALLGDNEDARSKAMSHLWGAVIHQGTPWTATGPAALVVAGIIFDERIGRGSESLRGNLMSFLAEVANAPQQQSPWSRDELEQIASNPLVDDFSWDKEYEDESVVNAFFARSLLGCIKVAPILMETMLRGLADASGDVRACAAMGAVILAKTAELQSHRVSLGEHLEAMARTATDADERSALVLAIGDLGQSPVAFLKDNSPAVRMCAALAPSLALEPAATTELISALERADKIDGWFQRRPPQFSMRPRFTVIKRLLEREKDFARLVKGAEVVVRITWAAGADLDWGPLLAAAFPEGSGVVTTQSQRQFLGALVKNKDLWDGNASKWFQQAGLPYNRDECKILVNAKS